MRENRHTMAELQEMQALPLNLKIKLTEDRIRGWVNEFGIDGVYVSFSGGKDSSVLLDIARNLYPDIKAMHVNTSLEYPELEKFVRTFNNVDIVKPHYTFVEVIKKYGYPMISKEVAECVWGARKFLTQVIEENSLSQSVSQGGTIRNTANYADSKSMRNPTVGGGYENKWRKLRGLGLYGINSRQRRCSELADMASRQGGRQTGHRGGGALRGFGKVTGIVTSQNSIDARLYKDYRQFQSAEAHGDSADERQSDSGEYP